MANGEENLKPFQTVEEAREKGRNGGIASGKARKKKKLMSQLYTDFLIKEHDITTKDGETRKIKGTELLAEVMKKVLAKGDSPAVRLMKEIREATEGSKVKLEGGVEVVYIDNCKKDI